MIWIYMDNLINSWYSNNLCIILSHYATQKETYYNVLAKTKELPLKVRQIVNYMLPTQLQMSEYFYVTSVEQLSFKNLQSKPARIKQNQQFHL